MLKALCFIMVLGLCSLIENTAKAQASAWNADMYAQFDAPAFSSSELAQQAIDLQAIDYALLHAAIFYATNEQRKKHKRPLFAHSQALEMAAFGHSKDMVEKNFLSHYSKIKHKKTPSDRLKLVGIENAHAAENVAYSYALQMSEKESYFLPSQNGGYFSKKHKGTPVPSHTYLSFGRSIVKQWMNSPGHRRNILDAKFTYLGCGALLDKRKNADDFPMIKATQNFSSKDALKE